MAKKNSLVIFWDSSSTLAKRMFSFWLLTVSVLILVACGGGGGGGGSDDDNARSVPKDSTNTPAANVILTGKATYTSYPLNLSTGIDYSMPTELPIRGAVVELHSSDGIVLDQQNTSSEGLYKFQAPAESNVVVVVKAALGTPQRPDTKIVDNTQQQALYTLIMPVRVRAIDTEQNFNADSGWDGRQYSGVRAAAPFAILDTLYKSQNLVRSADSNVMFPILLVNWSKRNIPTLGRIDLGEIVTSHFSADHQIYILGAADVDTDEYDSHIIAHEWLHYFEHAFSRSNSLGGQHIFDDILDPSVAFSEGLGNAFAAMALDNALYIDSIGDRQETIAISVNIEANSALGLVHPIFGISIDGFYSEASIHEILYDLYDRSDDENLQLGFTPIYNALVGKHKTSLAFTSVFSFIDALLEQDDINVADVRQLVASENIHNGDQYESFSQKIYTLLSSDGTRVEQDRNGDTLQTRETYGRISDNNGNKLDNRVFFKYFSPLSGCYTIDIVPKFGGDVVIHVPTQETPLDRSGPGGNELYHINLSANQSGSIAVGSKFSSATFSAQMSLTPGQCSG